MRRLSKLSVSALMASIGVVGLVIGVNQSRLRAAGPVEYTWNLVALGQGGWIGGPLFEDGTVGGGGAISLNNGKILAQLVPTGWTEDDAEQITVCFDVIQRKGPAVLPPSLCFGPALANGGPTHVNFLGIDHIFRITEIK